MNKLLDRLLKHLIKKEMQSDENFKRAMNLMEKDDSTVDELTEALDIINPRPDNRERAELTFAMAEFKIEYLTNSVRILKKKNYDLYMKLKEKKMLGTFTVNKPR